LKAVGERAALEVNMLLLLKFMKMIKVGPQQRYSYIYNTRTCPLGIRSMARHRQRVAKGQR
jgi:hypothetical protein